MYQEKITLFSAKFNLNMYIFLLFKIQKKQTGLQLTLATSCPAPFAKANMPAFHISFQSCFTHIQACVLTRSLLSESHRAALIPYAHCLASGFLYWTQVQAWAQASLVLELQRTLPCGHPVAHSPSGYNVSLVLYRFRNSLNVGLPQEDCWAERPCALLFKINSFYVFCIQECM